MAGIELPDWLRGVALVGKHGADYIPIAVDANGNMYILAQATAPGGVLVPIAADASGQLIMVPRGASGNYLAVDASGFLTAVMKALGPGSALTTIAADASGQLIMVPRGQSGNYLNVDASGNMSAAIKGAYGGSLVTIAVDALGNLQAILKGAYGGGYIPIALDADGKLYAYIADELDQWNNKITQGLSELASRLGAITSYERRGQLTYQEDFSRGPSGWAVSGTAGAAATSDPTVFLRGGYSMQISCGVTNDYNSTLSVQLGSFPVSNRIGFAVWLRLTNAVRDFILRVDYADPSGSCSPALKFAYPSGIIYYLNNVSQWIDTGTTWYVGAGYSTEFRFFKLVFDSTTGHYVRVIADGAQSDLSAFLFPSSASSIRRFIPQVTIESDGTRYGPVNLDSCVITTREPAN